MIKISQMKLPVGHKPQDLEQKIRKTLRLRNDEPFTYRIIKQSIDARKKPELFYVYTVSVKVDKESIVVKRVKIQNVTLEKERSYELPQGSIQKPDCQPMIVGAGPAGLFCAYILCQCGFQPILIERGAPMEERQADVTRFWETGKLLLESNVQFGEGGAGTFSDGKLNTAVKDPMLRNPYVLDTFIRFGAPEKIRYENKPHIGTDILANVIVNMRKYLLDSGCEILFHTKLEDLAIEAGRVKEVYLSDGTSRPVKDLVLAIGHSARDTFEKLYAKQLPMTAKNFAVGFRVEHPQSMIDEVMYGKQTDIKLPPSPYKVTSNFPNGRGVYSFCMCPGGYVVNSSSEEQALVVNGMSYSGRDSMNANSAIIVSVTPEDFGAEDALAGMRYQRSIEKKAYALAEGRIPQQLFGDFCNQKVSASYGEFESMTKGNTAFVNMRGIFSEDMENSFMVGMQQFARHITGFDRKDAIMSGIESRTSSPVRIERQSDFESEIKGIYPCGEGAGYAGGIMSAAMDGMKVAEAIVNKYLK